jgi:hypothetical protein
MVASAAPVRSLITEASHSALVMAGVVPASTQKLPFVAVYAV